MPETRRNPDGSLTEIPPQVLDCGHPFGPLLVTIGTEPDADGVRRRSYRCRSCAAITWRDL